MHAVSDLIEDVAALFVDAKGLYPTALLYWYDKARDATSYTGDLPIVAHPPCQRWCRLAGLVEARWGYKRGDDGGTFAFALETLRRVGGVLEHPAFSDAWEAYSLPAPKTGEGWCAGARAGEWTCYVEQWRYGHRARKATWLYYVGERKPFDLRWGHLNSAAAAAAGRAPWRLPNREYVSSEGRVYKPTHVVSHMKANGKGSGAAIDSKPLSKREAIHTPPEFLVDLVVLARLSRTRASLPGEP